MDFRVEIKNLNFAEADAVIREGDSSFEPALHQSIDISRMAEKWSRYAKFLMLRDDENTVALIVFYENALGQFVYIPHYVVLKEYHHMGLGHQALSRLINYVGKNYKCVRLEVSKNSQHAKDFYFKEGFEVVEEKEKSYILEKTIE